jgi:DNA-binding transcriptional LysR family regulator
VQHTDAIVARLEAEAELQAIVGLESGRLRLGSFASAAATVVPIAVAAFRERHPAVDLSVAMADPGDALPRLRAGELDIALSHDPEQESIAGVERVHLFNDPMHVALPAGHALARRRVVSLRLFADEPWMLGTTRSCPDARLFTRACHETHFEPRIAFESDDYPAILGFVAAGVGVALIPEMAARGVRDDVVIRSLGPRAPARPIAALLPTGYRAPTVQAMLDILQGACRDWVADCATLRAA